QLHAEVSRVLDPTLHCHVEDQVAVVGDVGRLFPTSHNEADPQPCHPLRGQAPQERQDLDRQYTDTELLHHLRLVNHDDKSLRGRGDQLLAEQRAAATLDQVKRRVNLVGTVDCQVDL